MPHTISDRSFHQASHYHALRRNVADGGWFACVSDATRSDLLAVFPAAEKRSLTIPNMVSHHYFPEESDWRHVPEVLRIRRNISLAKESARDAERAVAGIAPVRYLLMVSTIEPRKNHMALLAAWERLRASAFPDLQLVLVGALGWHHEDILQRLTPWLSRGGLHILSDVPADELRLLYRHAGVVVCPSFGEGFDYSGVEAMRCGSAVAASDIPVHRDVFGDAAQYFSPYAPGQLADELMSLLSPSGAVRRGELARLGAQVSNRYLPENVLPQWQRFLDSLPKRQLK
jgi:glycosyltransferase involved in cell wall biosynthesis